MRVMPTNNSGKEARALASAFPDRIGHLYAPGGQRGPFPAFPYALDNGAWPAFVGKRAFDDAAFRALLAWADAAAIPPRWVAAPDVVGDAAATSASWRRWLPELQWRGWPLAFVVQDGHVADDVPEDARVVFVGGSREWKRETAPYWCRMFPRVHVGRVNTERWVRYYDACGAESVDGSGWFRGDRRQLDGLWHYLRDTTPAEQRPPCGAMQPRLFDDVPFALPMAVPALRGAA